MSHIDISKNNNNKAKIKYINADYLNSYVNQLNSQSNLGIPQEKLKYLSTESNYHGQILNSPNCNQRDNMNKFFNQKLSSNGSQKKHPIYLTKNGNFPKMNINTGTKKSVDTTNTNTNSNTENTFTNTNNNRNISKTYGNSQKTKQKISGGENLINFYKSNNNNDNKAKINNFLNMYCNTFIKKPQPKLNMTNFMEGGERKKSATKRTNNTTSNKSTSRNLHKKNNSNVNITAGIDSGFINLLRNINGSPGPNLKRSLSGESFEKMLPLSKSSYNFNKVVNMKKNLSTANNLNMNFNISNINSDNINNNKKSKRKNSEVPKSAKKTPLSPCSFFQTQACLNDLFLSENRANGKTKGIFQGGKNNNNLILTEGNINFNKINKITKIKNNNNNLSVNRKKNESEKNLKVIKDPLTSASKSKILKDESEILKMDLLKNMKGILDLKEINERKRKQKQFEESRNIKNISTKDKIILKTTKKDNNTTSNTNNQEEDELDGPEDMHFFYISMIQKGRNMEKKIGNKKRGF